MEKSTNALTLELRLQSSGPLDAAEMSRAITVMNSRLQRLGVGNFELRAAGTSGITLRLLPHEKEPSRLARVAGSTGLFQIFDLETGLVPGISIRAGAPRRSTLYSLLRSARSLARSAGASSYYLFDGGHRLLAGPVAMRSQLWRHGRPRSRTDEVLGVPKGTELVSCGLGTSVVCPVGRWDGGRVLSGAFEPVKGQAWYYLFELPPRLTGGDLKKGSIRADFSQGKTPLVDFSLTSKGNEVFHEMTRDEWRRGQTAGPQHLAIVLDGKLVTFPEIDPADRSLSDGIDPSVSGLVIAGLRSRSEAREMIAVLRSGTLPASFHLVSKRIVPAG